MMIASSPSLKRFSGHCPIVSCKERKTNINHTDIEKADLRKELQAPPKNLRSNINSLWIY